MSSRSYARILLIYSAAEVLIADHSCEPFTDGSKAFDYSGGDFSAHGFADIRHHAGTEDANITDDTGDQVERCGFKIRVADDDTRRRAFPDLGGFAFADDQPTGDRVSHELVAAGQHVDRHALLSGRGRQHACTTLVEEPFRRHRVGPDDDRVGRAERVTERRIAEAG